MTKEKKITDYLHLYFGQQFRFAYIDYHEGEWVVWSKLTAKDLFKLGDDASITAIQLALRPLSDMTEEEWIYVLSLAKGIVIEDDSIYKVARTADNEVCIKTGKVQFLIRYQHCNDADDRVPKGVSFKLKYFYTSESLEVSERGINEVENEFNQVEGDWENFCFNQTEIFLFLLSKGFDLFGLIDAKLAIDSTTLK